MNAVIALFFPLTPHSPSRLCQITIRFNTKRYRPVWDQILFSEHYCKGHGTITRVTVTQEDNINETDNIRYINHSPLPKVPKLSLRTVYCGIAWCLFVLVTDYPHWSGQPLLFVTIVT